MFEENLSLLDWLLQNLERPVWKRTVRLLAAGLLAVLGILALVIAPETGNGFFLLAAAFLFLILGLRISVPEESLPVIPDGGPAIPLPEKPMAETAAPIPAPAAAAGTPASAEDILSSMLRVLRLPLAIALALWAQWLMDFRPLLVDTNKSVGWIIYGAAFLLAIWALLADDAGISLTVHQGTGIGVPFSWTRAGFAVAAAIFGLLAFAGFTDGMFHLIPLILLGIGLLYWIFAVCGYSGGLYPFLLGRVPALQARVRSAAEVFRRGKPVSAWSLLVLACFLALVFTRTYNLAAVPPEMTSDHAEKLMNVVDILEGRTYIFFASNDGREAVEFYLIALVSQLLGTGISFLSLKIVSISVGILTLPFLYLLGKELADRRVGLLAMILGGLGYWPDIISRLGLRLPLAMLFSAATLYFFLKALRRRSWNDFLWAGIALGIGLYGYTPIRILPVALGLAVLLFILHPSSKGSRLWSLWGSLVTILTAAILFIPFLRYAVDYPGDFWLRTITRLLPDQGPLENPVQLFFGNLKDAFLMFSWNDGTGWFNCVPLRPALDVVTGALFHLGAVFLVVHFLRRRSWESLFLILAVPILLLPSILALAEPGANPSLARTNAAIPVVFLIPALALVLLSDYLRSIVPGRAGGWIAAGAAAVMIAFAGAQNLDLTLRQYPEQYAANSENASELGAFIQAFSASVGRIEDVHLVPYAYWVDDRLVSIYSGLPWNHSLVLDRSAIAAFPFSGRPTVFLFIQADVDTLVELRQRFPNGYWEVVPSRNPVNNFVYYLVPGNSGEGETP